jgi:hypothetical protein
VFLLFDWNLSSCASKRALSNSQFLLNETNQKKNTYHMSNGLLAVINSLIAAGTTPSPSYCNFEFFPTTTKKFLYKLWLEQQFINPVESIDLGFFPHKRGTCFLCTLQDQEPTACGGLYD